MKSLFLVLVLLFLTGCASPNNENSLQTLKWHNFEKVKTIGSNTTSTTSNEIPYTFKNYELNNNKSTYVGNQIIEYAKGYKTSYDKTVYNPIKFVSLLNISGTKIQANKTYDYEGFDNKENGYYIKATDYEFIKVNSDGVLLSDSLIFTTGREYKKIFDTTGVKIFNPIVDSINNTKFDTYSVNSIKQELIYNGKNGTEIKILYREFNGDMVRPAFTQILQYDLKDGSYIRFKNFKIQVLSANNESIKYRVIED